MIGSDDENLLAALIQARNVRPAHGSTDAPAPPRRSLCDWTATVPPVPVTDIGPSRPLADILTERVSRREFQPPTCDQIGLLTARSGLIRSSSTDQSGADISHRAAPSPGARHPFELAVAAQEVIGLSPGLWVLDVHAAVLRPGRITATRVNAAVAAVADALHTQLPPPAVIFAVADPAQTLSRYPGGLSLLWREAGALLTLLHLIATDLKLESCIAGTVGVLCHDDSDAHAQIDLGAIALGAPSMAGITD